MRNSHRIAYVIGELEKGGAEYQLHELLRHLDREEFAPRVFSLSAGGYWAAAIRALGIPVDEFARRGSGDLTRLLGLRRRLAAFMPHLLHTVLWPGNCYGRLAALGLPIPVRITAERNTIVRPRWQVAVERTLDRVTDAYLVNCQAIADVLRDHERIGRDKIVVVPNGIDLGRLPPFELDRRPARRACGFDPNRRLVAQVGRLTPQKDYPTFLAAAAAIAAGRSDVDFLVVGAGEERAALEERARRLGLGARVRFLGLRDDVPDILRAVDVLALTSTYEGFPNVVLEAMATGAVAVATDVGGCRELVAPEQTGVLIAARDPAAVSAAAQRVLGDERLARRLALAARRRVESEFTVEVMAARTVAAYRTLLRGSRMPAAVAAA